MKTASELLVLAQKAGKPSKRRISTDKWMPVVDTLRRKNFTYAQIYVWLKANGEEVQANAATFTAAVSRRYRHWLKGLGSKHNQ